MKKWMIISCNVLISTQLACVISPKKLEGAYFSSCLVYDLPSAKVVINKDGKFWYRLPYVTDTITGYWTKKRDTLILNSAYFSRERQISDNLKYQITDITEQDKFLIRKGKLLVLMSNDKRSPCILKKR
jgi:hypothetical protein